MLSKTSDFATASPLVPDRSNVIKAFLNGFSGSPKASANFEGLPALSRVFWRILSSSVPVSPSDPAPKGSSVASFLELLGDDDTGGGEVGRPRSASRSSNEASSSGSEPAEWGDIIRTVLPILTGRGRSVVDQIVVGIGFSIRAQNFQCSSPVFIAVICAWDVSGKGSLASPFEAWLP